MVVSSALDAFKEQFELKYVLPAWKRRGNPVFEGGEREKKIFSIQICHSPDPLPSPFFLLLEREANCCIRTNPDEDHTNGFFIACFQRKSATENPAPAELQAETMVVETAPVKRHKNPRRHKRKRRKIATDNTDVPPPEPSDQSTKDVTE
jgi:hypothetical protein